MQAFMGVMNIYINIHSYEFVRKNDCQNWAFEERKSKYIDTKDILRYEQACCLHRACLKSLVMMSGTAIHYAMLWIRGAVRSL